MAADSISAYRHPLRRQRRIAEMDVIADPIRLDHLDLAVLGL
jgi:hypothetical protein